MNSNKIELYHGTSSIFLENILEKGILPWSELGFGVNGVYNPHRANRVFLALSVDKALNWARSTVFYRGGDPVVVTARIDIDQLTNEYHGETLEQSIAWRNHCATYGVVSDIVGYSRYSDFPHREIERFPSPQCWNDQIQLWANRMIARARSGG